MGRKNKTYQKDLHQQAYEKLTGMQAFGESKKKAVETGTDRDKIFSFSTYQTYWKHIKYFLGWVKSAHPEATTLKSARKYVGEWLQCRVEQGLSAWTIHTEAKALGKLYGIQPDDLDYYKAPPRRRADIKRSRVTVVRDRHFSITNNDELIRFCKGTGARRNVLEKLEGRDLWTREKMEDAVKRLESKATLTACEKAHLVCLTDALSAFPDQDYFVHHRKDKNGRYRFAPVIGPDKEQIIQRFRNTPEGKKVWEHVHANADIHSYRSDYAVRIYRQTARPIEEIKYNKINRGTNRAFQGDVYVCRKDESGKKLDRRAMELCSKALGHNRVSVVAINYLRGL
ncbi:MAG: hypothetical protein LUE92_14775 [Clostridiales bacterium]|nr:hypothetical protein [Clostridiales bacterium]